LRPPCVLELAVRLADFHVTLLIPDDYDDDRLDVMLAQLSRIDLRRWIEGQVQHKLGATKHLTTTLAVVEE
jgi:hypothetical protein